MDKNIQKILTELYQIDPSLKKHEAQLIKLVDSLIKAKPSVKWDEEFKNNLRAELLYKFSNQDLKINIKKPNPNYMNKLIYALGGMALALVIFLPLSQKSNDASDKKLSLNLSPNITKLGTQAFGPLSGVSSDTSMAREEMAVSSGSAAGFGGGGTAGVSVPATAPMVDMNEKMVSQDAMILPEYKVYKYVYKGEPFTVDNEQMNVYRRIINNQSSTNIANIVNQSDLDIVDLSKFKNTKIQNLSFVEDRNFGYQLNFNLQNGEIYIGQNWEKWPMQEKGTIDISQVPADDKLIAIADKFLSDYNINKDNYGTPQIENNWVIAYEQTLDKSNFYIPSVMTVIYPQKINDKVVYDGGGTVAGLRVSVDVENMKVSGLWNLTTQQYESSLYEMETNVDRLLGFAERGGAYPIYEYPDATIVEISLGTPTLQYMQNWQYDGRTSQQLYVPALVFPITDTGHEEYFWQKNVIIPLAKDLLNIEVPQPMPLFDVPVPEPEILR